MFWSKDFLQKEKQPKKQVKTSSSAKPVLHSKSLPPVKLDMVEPDTLKRIIKMNYHGTLKQILKNVSTRDFKVPIDRSGCPVTIQKIRVKRLTNETPFGFKAVVTGAGSEYFNTDIFYDRFAGDENDNVTEQNCLAYFPPRCREFHPIGEGDILFAPDTNQVRRKLSGNNVIKRVAMEVDNYMATHKHLEHADKTGVPRNSREYINDIIIYGNELCASDVKTNHRVYTDDESKQKVISISTKKDKKFFNFVNMTLHKDKLFMSKNWKNDKLEHEEVPAYFLEQGLELMDNIKTAIGVRKYLPIDLSPIERLENKRAWVSSRDSRKPEYCTLSVELEVEYQK